jgi:hypothetical protein
MAHSAEREGFLPLPSKAIIGGPLAAAKAIGSQGYFLLRSQMHDKASQMQLGGGCDEGAQFGYRLDHPRVDRIDGVSEPGYSNTDEEIGAKSGCHFDG